MKNKLLVNLFAVGIAALALTACESKSNVTEVCTDMVKRTLHGEAAATGDVASSVRGLIQLDGRNLIVAEYDFPSKNVNDNRLIHRSIMFGDGAFEPKKVDSLTYEYGDWQDQNTTYTLLVTPAAKDPYLLKYRGDALISPEGLVYGGSKEANAARVEKLEKVIASFPNTDWEGTYRNEFVLDSVFRDSIKVTILPPMRFIYDTIKIYDHMDTVSADTSCYYKFVFNRDANTLANTGHFYRRAVRSEYDRATKTVTEKSVEVEEYDCHWMFTDFASDSKFVISLSKSATPDKVEAILDINKYALDSVGVAASFTLSDLKLDFKRPVQP